MINVKEIFAKTFSLASALLNGKDVTPERLKARLEICSTCDKREVKGKIMRCGICKCSLGEQGLINLARYEETPKYGCQHPKGSKWKRAGV